MLRDWSLVLSGASAQGRVRAQDLVFAGPRGVGKTVVVTALARLSAAQGFDVVDLQAVTGQAGLVESLLEHARRRIDEGARAWQRARRGFERLTGVDLSVAGVGVGVTLAERGGASTGLDAGSLASALAAVADAVRQDAPQGGLLVTVDELQAASAPDLALLAAVLHRLDVAHPSAVVLFAGTGLPHTPEALRRAGVTHADRLFVLEPIPLTLQPDDARYAVVEPARRRGVVWEPDAADLVVEVTNGYPAHLQLFADAAWAAAAGPGTISLADARAAVPRAGRGIERRTLGPRWDRMTERQMEYLAAVALLGGRTDTSAVAAALGRSQQALTWLREQLVAEGDVYAPRRGEIALAVPLFGRYVLARYEGERSRATIPLRSLVEMAAGAGLPADSPALADRD